MKITLGERIYVLMIVVLFLVTSAVSVPKPSQAATAKEIALLKGADRQKVLEAGARKEGKLLWYTTLIVNQAVRPIKEAFEKEYPFVEIEFFRGNSTRIAQRMMTEYQAKKFFVDIIDGTSSTPLVKKAGLLTQFFSPHLGDYPRELKDSQGYWGVANLYFMTLGYNTRLLTAKEVPKSWEDLLNPRWKGKMIWVTSAGSGAPIFLGNVLLTLGEEAGMAYLRKLAKQKIAKSTASGRAMLDLVGAGEYHIGINIFNHHAVISKKKGAPVEWQPLEPVAGLLSTFGLAKDAPHPHTAMLFIDFLLSEKGQKVLQKANYLPSHPKIPAKDPTLKPGGGRFNKANYIKPGTRLEKRNEWVKIFKKLYFK